MVGHRKATLVESKCKFQVDSWFPVGEKTATPGAKLSTLTAAMTVFRLQVRPHGEHGLDLTRERTGGDGSECAAIGRRFTVSRWK